MCECTFLCSACVHPFGFEDEVQCAGKDAPSPEQPLQDPAGVALTVTTAAFNMLASESHTIRFAKLREPNWTISVQLCENIPFQLELSPRLRGAMVNWASPELGVRGAVALCIV